MPQRVKSTHADALFGALANPTRRDILDLLLSGAQTVQVIAERFDMARPSVSEHLKVLKDAGLVSEERQGRHRYYAIDPVPLYEVQTWLSPYERFWRDRMGDLGRTLDEMPED
ncbi:ArsR/SmtB family transcription factor [Tenggerimyces flavus]|uniref:ArsR/SmtB family transcription factor n=1 Tax=Tenggerimyces flavus TaxID=1708749 RepID=A0ABV7YEF1_9ACTN|nr:metalloregulator ArsR/SmtB family transcription factor [Tenggerimyces flavus]MBM7787017.1 DNA-binding transcriptional ArsR family regulator [Tenggerimyces flavus]